MYEVSFDSPVRSDVDKGPSLALLTLSSSHSFYLKMSSSRTDTTHASTSDSNERSSQASTLTPLTARQQGKRPITGDGTPSVDESSSDSLPPKQSSSTIVPSQCLTFKDGKKVTQVFMAQGTKQFSVKTEVSVYGKDQVQVLTEYTTSKYGGMQHRKKEGFWGDLTRLPDGQTCDTQGDATYGISNGQWKRI
jgi:hypothetical protein